jgi:predicted nucleotide-binding protein
MSLPIRITVDDIQALCSYLVTKPTGATLKETRGVVDKKHLDFRKLVAMKEWHLISEVAGKYKITGTGSDCVRSEAGKVQVLSNVIRETPPYLAVLERVALQHEDAMTATDVAAHWYDHFKDVVSGSAAMLNGQAVVFLQVAAGAGFGRLIIGRKGQATRFGFNMEAVTTFVSSTPSRQFQKAEKTEEKPADEESVEERADTQAAPQPTLPAMLGQGIFVAHGKNKKPLEQLKKILEQFRIPYRVAVEEPNLSRPISGKVREIMESCNCAILIFSADEEFKDKDGNTIWRPSENVVNELGATAFLYDNRIVIMREEGVTFPTNFRDIGFISFEKDQLDAKTLDILKELIGFGIVKVST